MVAVVIIAILAASVLPSVSEAMRDRRTQQAAISVLDALRLVRTRAMYRGLAQEVVIRSNGDGLILSGWEGSSNSCRGSLATAFPTDGVAAQSTITLDLTAQEYARDRIHARVSYPSGESSFVAVCYTPTGRTFFSMTGGGDFNDPSPDLSGGYLLEVWRVQSDGSDAGTRRTILVPFAGVPRFRP